MNGLATALCPVIGLIAKHLAWWPKKSRNTSYRYQSKESGEWKLACFFRKGITE